MAVIFKDIDDYSQKSSVVGTEKIPVSDTEYITPGQITSDCITKSEGGTLDEEAEINILDENDYGTRIYCGSVDLGSSNMSTGVVPGYIQVSDTSNNGYKYVQLYPNAVDVAVDSQHIYTQAFPAKSGTFAMTSDIPSVPVTDVTVGGSSVVSSGTAVIPAIPSAPGTLNTTATTAQSTSASEALSGSVTLHKVAKTGTYSDLIGTPTIPDISNCAVIDSNKMLDHPAGGGIMSIQGADGAVYALGPDNEDGDQDYTLAITAQIPSLSGVVSKSGDTMADDATLTFADSDDYYNTIISPTGVSVSDVDDGVFIRVDGTEFGVAVQDAASNPAVRVVYAYDGIHNGVWNPAVLEFPTLSGTLALTSQIPAISTNVQTDKASDTKTSSPKSVYDEVHPAMASSQPSGGFVPNIFYNLGTVTGTVTFSLASATDNTIVNHYYWAFDTSSTAPTITWPSGVSWMGGSAPTISASKHYEISILNNIGTYMEV